MLIYYCHQDAPCLAGHVATPLTFSHAEFLSPTTSSLVVSKTRTKLCHSLFVSVAQLVCFVFVFYKCDNLDLCVGAY